MKTLGFGKVMHVNWDYGCAHTKEECHHLCVEQTQPPLTDLGVPLGANKENIIRWKEFVQPALSAPWKCQGIDGALGSVSFSATFANCCHSSPHPAFFFFFVQILMDFCGAQILHWWPPSSRMSGSPHKCEIQPRACSPGSRASKRLCSSSPPRRCSLNSPSGIPWPISLHTWSPGPFYFFLRHKCKAWIFV